MPFTLAHVAAALPFRRMRLNMSALVVGTMAPDFEYFLRLAPRGGFGHTIPGALVLSLPLALLVLWFFHNVVKRPVISLMPDAIQNRLTVDTGKFRLSPPPAFVVIAASALAGIATHILWDLFTHPNTWLYHHWLFLSQTEHLPIVGPIQHYKIVQHVSTIVGCCILGAWLIRWYRTTRPRSQLSGRHLPWRQKLVIIALMLAIASLGSIARTIIASNPSSNTTELLIGKAVCTFIALIWWQLVIYGLMKNQVEKVL